MTLCAEPPKPDAFQVLAYEELGFRDTLPPRKGAHCTQLYDILEDAKDRAGNKCPVPFVQSTRRASSSQKVPDTYFPLIAKRLE